ncbi:MAG: hypothetical protein RL497_901 [Pseudomonadota bacterium]
MGLGVRMVGLRYVLFCLWVFSSGVTHAQGEASSIAHAQGEASTLYRTHCQQCHGAGREGGVGPNLADAAWNLGVPARQSVSQVIREGIPGKAMPAWQQVLKPEQIDALADWLIAQAAGAENKAVIPPANTAEITPLKEDATLKKVRLPPDFVISIYADQLENPRNMAVDNHDTVYVGSRKAGKVVVLRDSDENGVADKKYTLAQGLNEPTGVALHQQNLYVAETNRILRFKLPGADVGSLQPFDVIKGDLPNKGWHAARAIKIGPDNKIYIPIGAPCNVCDVEANEFGKIWRMNLDGSGFELVAKGVRNSVGLAWHPETQTLWFGDNGRDYLGENSPSCELNFVSKKEQHFGFPYCHGGSILDPEWGEAKKCETYTAPVALLGPHVAPLGLSFNTADQFPDIYKNQLFIAEHGSWNRVQKNGYRISLITLNGHALVSDSVFADFLVGDEVIGRPVDIAWLKDGSMLVSDDEKGRIYRIRYVGERPSLLKKLINKAREAL